MYAHRHEISDVTARRETFAANRTVTAQEVSLLVARFCVRFEVFAAVTMKNVVLWDIKTQFVPHRRHVMSPLQSPAG
jgi:hypothetical protein